MKLTVKPEQKKKAKLYSEKVKVGYYAIRYNQPEHIARRQHYIGKLGEFALYNLFLQAGYKLEEPDCEIHSKKKHEPDLILNKYKIHIKTQRQEEALIYGASWLFKKASIDASTNSLAALITLNGEDIYLDALIPLKSLIKRFKAPKKAVFKQDTLAIYKEDLPKKPYIKLLTRSSYDTKNR